MQPANTIVGRVAEFLKGYPPFDLIPYEELKTLAAAVTITFKEDDTTIFSKGDPPGAHFYVLKTGCVMLHDSDDRLVDQCDEGDIFGVRSMLSGKPYVMRAQVNKEALVYQLPNKVFKPLIERYPTVALYFASGLASGQTVLRKQEQEAILSTDLPEEPLSLNERVTVEGKKKLVSCSSTQTVKEVAMTMSEHGVGSMIVVDDVGAPTGILTDTDLRKNVATGQVAITEPVAVVMNSPVITIPNGLPVFEVILKMIEKGVHHLCITVDGTDQSKAVGVVSERDLLLIHSNDPAVLLKEIKQVKDINRLPALRDKAEKLIKLYLENEVSISYISQIISAINDALIVKAIAYAQAKLKEEDGQVPDTGFCWISLGSEGREEQLLRTDQDNAIIYAQPTKGMEEFTKSYYLKLAEHITQILSNCGFEKCPADMMASNPKWCVSLDEWESYFKGWVMTPEPKALMFSTIFFDYRFIAGDKELVVELDQRLRKMMDKERIFLNHLAKNAILNPPPLSFFKGFVVERSGEHADEFDIKLRAMMPLVDAARVLSLDYGLIEEKNTMKRFEALKSKDEKNAKLYEEAAQAYGILMRIRVLSGLEHKDSGRYVPIDKLSKFDKQRLRNAFEPVHDLQRLLEVKYQLSFFQG